MVMIQYFTLLLLPYFDNSILYSIKVSFVLLCIPPHPVLVPIRLHNNNSSGRTPLLKVTHNNNNTDFNDIHDIPSPHYAVWFSVRV